MSWGVGRKKNKKRENNGAFFEVSESMFQALVINNRRLCAAVHTQDLDLLLPAGGGGGSRAAAAAGGGGGGGEGGGGAAIGGGGEEEEEITNITATSASFAAVFKPRGTHSNYHFGNSSP